MYHTNALGGMYSVLRVLIVDDDAIVCEGLSKEINWEGMNAKVVGEARNGQKALELVLSEKPDLIISDIKMPVMDGLELCKHVYQLTTDVSIFLLSAYEDFSYAQSAMQYGVKEYIIKPIDCEKLNHLIEKIKNLSFVLEKKQITYEFFCSNDLQKNIINNLKSNNQDFFVNLFENVFTNINNFTDLTRECCMNLINILYDCMEEIGFNHKACIQSKERVISEFILIKNVADIKNFTKKLYFEVLQFRVYKKDNHSDSLLAVIKNIIDENFSNPDMNVSYIAQKLNFSANYISNIFNQVAGINISTYITNIRVEKSMLLLKDPAVKINDISTIIGYGDSHYYAKVFKKYSGLTPSEYRNIILLQEHENKVR